MGYGPMAIGTLATTDMVAPGLPVFISATQRTNTSIRLVIAVPSVDADGNNLTGLTKLTVVTVMQSGTANPLTGLTMTAAMALPGVTKLDIALAPADAGQQKTVDVPVLTLGGTQVFGAACSD